MRQLLWRSVAKSRGCGFAAPQPPIVSRSKVDLCKEDFGAGGARDIRRVSKVESRLNDLVVSSLVV